MFLSPKGTHVAVVGPDGSRLLILQLQPLSQVAVTLAHGPPPAVFEVPRGAPSSSTDVLASEDGGEAGVVDPIAHVCWDAAGEQLLLCTHGACIFVLNK